MEATGSRPLIPWWATDFGSPEIERVAEAIEGRHISQGKLTREFEDRLAERLGVPYVVCTTSGTTALTMALLACGIGRGDEVIVPDRTWIATAHAVMMTGAEVRLVDVCYDAPVMDLDAEVPEAHAYIPVNLNGRICELKRPNYLPAICIEDSCQSFPNPPRGDIACYSLSVAKIISTGQGGFCATRDEALYKELLALRTHDVADAMVPEVLAWKRFGYNFRFTDIQAAIGLAQLDRLDERLLRLAEIHALYKRNGVPVAETPTPLYNEIVIDWPYEYPLREQEKRRAYFRDACGIECRPFYPPLHRAPYLMPAHKTKYHDYEFPNAMKWSHGLVLPSGPTQRLEDIQRVCDLYHAYGYQ